MKTNWLNKMLYLTAMLAAWSYGTAQNAEHNKANDEVVVKIIKNCNGSITTSDSTIILNGNESLEELLSEMTLDVQTCVPSGTGSQMVQVTVNENGEPEIQTINSVGTMCNIDSIMQTIGLEWNTETGENNTKTCIKKIVIAGEEGKSTEHSFIVSQNEEDENDLISKEKDVIIMKNISSGESDNVSVITLEVSENGEISIEQEGAEVSTENIDIQVSEDGNQITVTAIINVNDINEEEMKMLAGKGIDATEQSLDLQNFNLYPNPTNGMINISFDVQAKEKTIMRIFDINGKEVYKEKIKQSEGIYNKQVDLSGNKKGVYFLQVLQGKESLTKKVVLE